MFGGFVVGLWVAVAGAGEVPIPDGEGHAEGPVWSADGKFLAFEVARRDPRAVELFVASMRDDTATKVMPVRLPRSTGRSDPARTPRPSKAATFVQNPRWLPDPRIVLFEGRRGEGRSRVYFYAPGGASASEMINRTLDPASLTFPVPSRPDGARVLYVTSGTGNGDLRLWTRAAGEVTAVTDSEEAESSPNFSPDAARVVFSRTGATEDVIEVDLATRTEVVVAGGVGDQIRPTYAGDGRIVYFTSERGPGRWDLAVTDLATGTRRILATDVRVPTRALPGVSPDGAWVAWTSGDPTQNTDVNLTRVDGRETVPIPTGGVACGEPAIGGREQEDGALSFFLAYTSLGSAAADWRGLTVVDITDVLAGAPAAEPPEPPPPAPPVAAAPKPPRPKRESPSIPLWSWAIAPVVAGLVVALLWARGRAAGRDRPR